MCLSQPRRPVVWHIALADFASRRRIVKARVGIFRWLLICEAAAACVAPRGHCQIEARATDTANVLVWVRDGSGAPVSGLTADDFVVTENGVRDRVIAVRSFFTDAPAAGRNSGKAKDDSAASKAAEAHEKSWQSLTHVLVIISPMSAAGRQHALLDAIQFLSRSDNEGWKIALLDDAGEYVHYGAGVDTLRKALKGPKAHFSPNSKTDGSWMWKASRAIEELGILPGRHAIIVFSDRYGMGPSNFIGPAVMAQAALYTIQISGPEVVVPFGGAAEVPSSESGPIPFVTGEYAAETLKSTFSTLGYLGEDQSERLRAADETGGLAARDLKDAFGRIAGDSAGYYLLSFEAKPQERDGTWHPFSVSIRPSHLSVKGPRFYMVPFESAAGEMPTEMKEALSSNGESHGLHVAANAWLFPDQGGVHFGAFAAELNWTSDAPSPGSRLKIYAELINESMHGVAGSWFEEKEWPGDVPTSASLHWQREAHIYPGSYLLRVIAMDTASRKTGTGTYAFMARPLDLPAFRFSGIVLADNCLSTKKQEGMRHNLFDPMLLDGCKLAPTAAGHFNRGQDPTVLVRAYPPNEKFAKLVLNQWKAYAVVDDAQSQSTELEIRSAEVRGLLVTGKLMLSQMSLKPGPHQLTVLLVLPGEKSKKQTIPLTTKFSIEP